ncbi:hypothetical protein [Rhizobium sp. 'Codium 1']|uniref:hypothetical protein n=1 Tax=Rhizobium sp. 'Codium 1' TaxID=2940484 RepID=UPI001E5E7340|nr:hypothetical protein [Rhizobium sp. 'Codium 1']MCC8934892.1 hypothetical protein [Rhizobium sp. 'Codium 1']
MEQSRSEADKKGGHDIIACVAAILLVIPAFFTAMIVAYIYTLLLTFVIGEGHWIPYFYEVSVLWFPALLRGMITGVLALTVSRYFFPRSDVKFVALAVFAFWLLTISALLLMSGFMQGFDLNTVGVVSLVIGLAVGLRIVAT